MSADLLRRAAEMMRERAGAARAGRWFAVEGEDVEVRAHWRHGDHNVALCEGSLIPEGNVANAEHIASWNPSVALAVADWLDGEVVLAWQRESIAEQASDDARSYISPSYAWSTKRAFAVARAYLGERE